MSLATGMRFGVYEVLSLIGAGGMGEAYRAGDSRQWREIAVKVLPDALACDISHLARFEREAQLQAALNHPHITAIFGLEKHEGKQYLMIELVEGATLVDRLCKDPLPQQPDRVIIRQDGNEARSPPAITTRMERTIELVDQNDRDDRMEA